MKVREVMRRDVASCHPEESMATAARRMWDRNCGSLPIVDNTFGVVGVITDRDICMSAMMEELPLDSRTVAQAMTRSPVTCRPEDDVFEVQEKMRARRVRRLPVVEADGRLAGVVSLTDLVRRAAGGSDLPLDEVSRTLAAITGGQDLPFARE